MSININLNPEWRVTSDPMNYILEQKHVRGEDAKSPGEISWKQLSFPGTLSQALEGYQKHRTLTSDVDSLKGLFGLLVAIQADIQVVRDAFSDKTRLQCAK